MKASLVSKIIIILCFLTLVAGFLRVDKYNPFVKTETQNSISNTNKIAVINLDGAIASSAESSFFSLDANASSLLKSLINLQTDNEIKGVIVKINSPGGTVAMSQNIYNQIIRLRDKKPVIVLLDDVAASGGYYIASAADRIIAQEGTLTGSIGVIFSVMDYHNLLTGKLGINPVVIKSGKFKDIGSPTREMTADEKHLLQDIVNDSYNQFIEAIIRGRINRNDNYNTEKTLLTAENLKKYADGRVFTGRQAKQFGFVDMLGDIDTAKNSIENMAQQKFNNNLPAKLINYSKRGTLGEYFSSFAEYNSKSNFQLKDFIPTSMILSRKPLYLWE